MIPFEKNKRLLKFINLFLLMISTLTLLTSLSTTNWLEGDGFRQGLWRYCLLKRQDLEYCFSTQNDEWLVFSSSFAIVSFVFTLFASITLSYHIVNFRNNIKRKISLAILFIFIIISIVSLLCSLISFPVVFATHQIHIHHSRFSSLSWKLSWSYGMGWASMIFQATALSILSIDPNPTLPSQHHTSITQLNTSPSHPSVTPSHHLSSLTHKPHLKAPSYGTTTKDPLVNEV